MKIYLQDSKYNWIEFLYENISDLKSEFELRKIFIGDSGKYWRLRKYWAH